MNSTIENNSQKNSVEQSAFDFGYVDFVAVTSAKTKKQRQEEQAIVARAQQAAKITAADLVAEWGPSKFLPESRALFAEADAPKTNISGPAESEKSSADQVSNLSQNNSKNSGSINSRAVQVEKIQETIGINVPDIIPEKVNDTQPTPDKPVKVKKIAAEKPNSLPVTSLKGMEIEKARIAAERESEQMKPVIGLMRTVHSVDRKLKRTALTDNLKMDHTAAAKAAAANNPWADMIRARTSNQQCAEVVMEDGKIEVEVETDAPRISAPKPRF